MIPAIDTEYGQLLQEVQPKVIHTKKRNTPVSCKRSKDSC
jgi:hypothetical protein